MNSIDKIFVDMCNGKYTSIKDTKGKVYVGIVNSIMREDGSGKNWIVSISHNLVNESVFIHAM